MTATPRHSTASVRSKALPGIIVVLAIGVAVLFGAHAGSARATKSSSKAHTSRAKVSLKIRSPKNHALVAGSIRWKIKVHSRDRIARVRFYVGKRRVWTDGKAPFKFRRKGKLNTGGLKNGRHRLTVIALSRKGVKAKRTLIVTVGNAAASAQTGDDPTARAYPSSHIRVDWPQAPGTTQAQIYRGSLLLATRPAGITTYTDSMLWFATTYSYTVKMLDASGRVIATHGPLTASTAALPPGGYPPTMPKSSVWATPIAAGYPSYSRSGEFVNYLLSHKGNANMSTRSYGIPVYEAEANDPKFGPFSCVYGCDINRNGPVPIPPYAVPDPGSDAHMTVISSDGSTAWDYFKPLKDSSGRWYRTSAGVIVDMRGSGVISPSVGGANAANFASLGGLIRPEEIAQGRISHALALGVPGIASGRPACPAAKNQGVNGGIIPEGTRFQLDPAVDVGSLGLPAWQQTVARALQTYGGYVRDNAGVVTVYGETSSPTLGGRRYDGWSMAKSGINSNESSQSFSSNFPWNRLRALNFSYC